MPFTFAHPSIVLPLGLKQNKYLDFTGLVIGTMAPDFEYFIHFRPIQIVGHTFLGQLYFNLPIAFIVACIYHYILKEPLILNLPQPYCDRYYYLVKRRWRINSLVKLIVFCYSTLLGAFTHVFWDSFTHKTGFFVEKIGLLSEHVNLIGFKIPIYKILQHGSTLLGFIGIIIYLFAIQDNNIYTKNHLKTSNSYKVKFWSGVILISAVIMVLIIFQLDSLLIGGLIVTGINSVFIGVIIMSIATRLLFSSQ